MDASRVYREACFAIPFTSCESCVNSCMGGSSRRTIVGLFWTVWNIGKNLFLEIAVFESFIRLLPPYSRWGDAFQESYLVQRTCSVHGLSPTPLAPNFMAVVSLTVSALLELEGQDFICPGKLRSGLFSTVLTVGFLPKDDCIEIISLLLCQTRPSQSHWCYCKFSDTVFHPTSHNSMREVIPPGW